MVPAAIERLAGFTAIDTNFATVTDRLVLPFTPAELAVMLDVPFATPEAMPLGAMVATPLLDEVQVTELVRFNIEPSE